MNRTQDLQNCNRAEAEAQARQENPAQYWQARAYEAEIQAHELAEALRLCVAELVRLDGFGDATTRIICADARAALANYWKAEP